MKSYDFVYNYFQNSEDLIRSIKEYTRISKINSNEYNNLKFSYNYSNNMVRIILIGDPNEINELIMC